MAAAKFSLPDCGIFRTTQALPGHEEEVPAGALVYFHNHSDSGLPQVILPDHCLHNRWHFRGPGVVFRSLAWVASLHPLPAQGFYFLKEDLVFDGGSWPRHTLVQLGYSRRAEPILFIAQERASLQENDLFFSDKGVRIDPEVLDILVPLVLYREAPDDHPGEELG
jgi:hypothetical protein